MVEAAKLAGERLLVEKKEKLMLELQKLKQRVDEFNDYGELDMMAQYVQDVRAVQKRLGEAQELIEWVNKVRVGGLEKIKKSELIMEVGRLVQELLRNFFIGKSSIYHVYYVCIYIVKSC